MKRYAFILVSLLSMLVPVQSLAADDRQKGLDAYYSGDYSTALLGPKRVSSPICTLPFVNIIIFPFTWCHKKNDFLTTARDRAVCLKNMG